MFTSINNTEATLTHNALHIDTVLVLQLILRLQAHTTVDAPIAGASSAP